MVDLEVFRTVRRVAEQELREMASAAPTAPEVAAARAALDAATTTDEVVALETLVRRAGSVLGLNVPADRTVRIADRSVSWADAGASYSGVAAAAREAEAGAYAEQRDTLLRSAKVRNPNPFEVNATGG